jgi:hypothetical protein
LLGREDKIELLKAKRVVDKRRGDLLGPPHPGTRNDIQPLHHDVEVGIHASTVTNYRRLATAWPILEPRRLQGQERPSAS